MTSEAQNEGLSSEEAKKRLKEEGYNELPSSGRRSALAIVISVLSEPMFGLLLAAGIVYLLLGDLREAVVISFLALLSVSIAIVQEWRSEKVLEALRDLTSPRALVVRDGKEIRIAGREVVRGDLLIIAEGDRIPADARLVTPDPLLADESLLTGESVPVTKKSYSEDENKVFAGTLIVGGSARAVVTETGDRSEIGKIGQALRSIETEQPRLQQQTRKIVRFFAVLSISLSVLSAFLYGYMRDDWMEGILSGIALGMSLLPEEFPLVLTVFMVMGAWRISKANVLTRKASAIETLGSATVLCTDKTGTLTQNRMSLVFLQSDSRVWREEDGEANLSPEIKTLLFAGMKASKKDSRDPMDLAFLYHPFAGEGNAQARPEAHYGLKPDLLMMAQVFNEDGKYKIFAKGAPESIAKACGFTAQEMKELHARIEILASEGLRVLGLAVAETDNPELPEGADGFDYRFLGLAGFADPLRENVPDAVAECHAAGIRIIMITGDYPATARAIAAQAGLKSGKIVTGTEIANMNDETLRSCVAETDIFARISPDQKLRIISALKKNGEIVAMTGDGVNDAPSLKAAHIGVAMGKRGTDVAREASSIVLLDDNFGSLVNTVALGRRIYDNLRKAMVYIVAIHVPIAGLALLPLLFNGPLILTPLLIALLEMVIDPACSIILEAEEAEKNVMKRPPRSPSSSILPPAALAWGGTQGALALIILGFLWSFSSRSEMPEDEVRSLVFMSLVVVNIALILANRSFSPSILLAFERRNPFLGWGVLGVACLFAVLLFWPPASELFGFGHVRIHDIVLALGAGGVFLVIVEFLKPFFQRRLSR